ncbi:MAG: diguanylate cyclase [Pseudomonadota bacterium]
MPRRFPRHFMLLVLAIAALDGILLLFMYRQGENELQRQLTNQSERMIQAANFSISNILGMLRPLAAMIAAEGTNRELVRNAAESNMWGERADLDIARELLRDYLQDGWNAWRSGQYFRQLHFVLADGSSLLRMHKPDFHGDDLTEVRPMIMDSMARNTPRDGYEFGKLYGGFRAVVPISENNPGSGDPAVVAAVEVGLSGQSVFHAMTEQFGIQAAIILHEDYVIPRLDKLAYEQHGIRQMDACASCFLDTSTDVQVSDIIRQLPAVFHGPRWQLVKLEQQTMLVASMPLHDYWTRIHGGPSIGTILLWHDADRLLAQHRQAWHSLLLTNLLSITILLLAAQFIMRRSHGWMEQRISQQTERIRTLLTTSQEQAMIDPLTMCYNRRYLTQRMDDLIAQHARHGHSFAVLMIDIDHFKNVNDQWGHLCGDEVLRLVAEILRNLSRSGDVCARYGGEEFCILLPNSTREGAHLLGERIRLEIINKRKQVTCARDIPLSVSIGVAEYAPGEDSQQIIKRTDSALYAAKTQGRNRVSAN